MNTLSNFIHLQARADKAPALADFLATGAGLVSETEPLTELWWALRSKTSDSRLAIFDLFTGADGRAAHFGGAVAAALKDNADELVEGGWPGVIEANHSLEVIADLRPATPVSVTEACAIRLDAAPGKDDELASFLMGGRDIVAETEPNTPYWFALRSEDRPGRYMIVDFFTDAAGRKAHFEGKVAQALNSRAEELVVGGWERGVVENIADYAVLATAPR